MVPSRRGGDRVNAGELPKIVFPPGKGGNKGGYCLASAPPLIPPQSSLGEGGDLWGVPPQRRGEIYGGCPLGEGGDRVNAGKLPKIVFPPGNGGNKGGYCLAEPLYSR